MPSAALDFRASCGCFHPVLANFLLKRAKDKAAMYQRVLVVRSRVGGVLLGVYLASLYMALLLQQANDIEKNPGPKQDSTMRQTRLTSQSDRRTSVESTLPTAGTSTSSSQGEPEPIMTNPTLKDVMTFLAQMNANFNSMKNDLKDVKDSHNYVKDELIQMKKETIELKMENKSLREENERLKTRVDSLEQKTDDLECRSKRNNIIIHGIPRTNDETWQETENVVNEMLKDKLKMSENVCFERVHRVNGKPDSPIVACCTFFKDKGKILKEKTKLKGTNIFIGEDFSGRVREVRKSLSPYLKKAKEEGKRAFMIYDHIRIDGTNYVLDQENKLKKMR